MSKPYCGITDVPKGHHKGTQKECTQTKQVRRWGLKKVSRADLNEFKKINNELKEQKKLINKVQLQISGLRGRRIKFQRELKEAPITGKKKAEENLAKVSDDIRKVVQEFKKIEEEQKRLKNLLIDSE